MSEDRTHNRKRSPQNTGVDQELSRRRLAFDALKEKLYGIEEAEKEMPSIAGHVSALRGILRGAKKLKVTFSTVMLDDLKKAGLKRKLLIFSAQKVTELANVLPTKVETQIRDLHDRIKKIYTYVNMDYETGSRMILDAILLALAEIASSEQREVAILPGMKIAQGDGVQIAHPDSGFELWLSGDVDYAVIEYDNVKDNKLRLLQPGISGDDAFRISKGRLFLVQAKRQNDRTLISYIPEAVSQAVASSMSANLPEVRFCLSDGKTWIFFILKEDNGNWTYYESVGYILSADALETSDKVLREILVLVCEWLKPTATDLFMLE